MVLQILVIGGGIAGLSTALALRRAGHRVQVFEASHLAYEDTVGPTVHIGPKSCDLMRNWEYDATVAQGVLIREIAEFNHDGTQTQRVNEHGSQPPGWMYFERNRLHQAFLKSASMAAGSGQPVVISLEAPVKSVHPSAPSITLDDGRVVHGDVIIGADGFHSTARRGIADSEIISSGPRKVAVHFSVAMSKLTSTPVAQRFHEQAERYEKWFGVGMELSVYAVEAGRLLFDFTLAIQGGIDVTPRGVKQMILNAFESGHLEFVQLLAAVDLGDIHFWTQPSYPQVDEWTYKYLALVGDAAHPFLPHELPGTSQALNDAAALAAELSCGISAGDIEARLAAWEGPRKERVRVIQQSERG
ncbi:hypothetical protein BDW59DRAFT_161083 [Aspergillus cavernicola]|uniref:FAD-binding domain-containing protein n=1 Tax=Aspergillus cavernicola TaxID=176166 RepID=A0ABR4IER6_9EURO